MQDEQNAPQDEEVEAHHRRPAPAEDPGRLAREDDDEVEAHSRARPAPSEAKSWEPSE